MVSSNVCDQRRWQVAGVEFQNEALNRRAHRQKPVVRLLHQPQHAGHLGQPCQHPPTRQLRPHMHKGRSTTEQFALRGSRVKTRHELFFGLALRKLRVGFGDIHPSDGLIGCDVLVHRDFTAAHGA